MSLYTYVDSYIHMYVCMYAHTYLHGCVFVQLNVCFLVFFSSVFKLTMYVCIYRISGNIGDIFNLAVWRSVSKSPNLHRPTSYALSLLCNCQILSRPMLNYSLILCKSPNLMINVSRYTVISDNIPTVCDYVRMYVHTSHTFAACNIHAYYILYVQYIVLEKVQFTYIRI